MKADFSQGKMWKNILAQSLPLMLAQLVQLLYNIIDRIYIGRLSDTGGQALTGIGVSFPVITLIAAFTSLFGLGGAPLFSIARGEKNEERAEKILAQTFSLLTVSSFVLCISCYLFSKEILIMFGAGDNTIGYAKDYLEIYLIGTTFSMLSTGLNSFINAQGFPKIGMGTICVGAIINLVLDPIFIYGFNMGVKGAAIATVISQFTSFVWVMVFFFGKRSIYRIKIKNIIPDWSIVRQICALGLAGFIVQATNCAVQIVCNRTLEMYGGDLYVGIMTVINSVREILSLPAASIGGGSQPVLGYNYGAKQYKRVKQGIRFTAITGIIYMTIIWIVVVMFPHFIMSIFTEDKMMIDNGTAALGNYFFGFFFMAFQFAGQSTFTALGCAKRAIFFSWFRKILIVVPLTILLPKMGMGVMGVFMAEPVSNFIGGLASFFTMWFTLYRKLPNEDIKYPLAGVQN